MSAQEERKVHIRGVIVGLGCDFTTSFEPQASVAQLVGYLRSIVHREFIVYLARGGANNEWLLTTDSIEYDLLKIRKLPSSVKAMMNDDNRLDPLKALGDPAFEFPDQCCKRTPYTLQVLAEIV